MRRKMLCLLKKTTIILTLTFKIMALYSPVYIELGYHVKNIHLLTEYQCDKLEEMNVRFLVFLLIIFTICGSRPPLPTA